MRIISIEPTPSPNSMKLILNEELPANETRNFNKGDDVTHTPDYIKKLLAIDGVKNIYHVTDFIAIERNPRVAWEVILPEVRAVFGEEIEEESQQQKPLEAYGDVKVFVQMFRGIPVQVKLDDGHEEKRFGLPPLFMNAVMKASEGTSSYVMERKWVEQSTRYGSMDEIGNDVVEEIIASYDENRVNELVENAIKADKTGTNPEIEEKKPNKLTPEVLDNPDWRVRYAALDRMDDPTLESLPLLSKALEDEKMSIRRIATAYLGMIEEPEVLPYLYKALKDKVVTVRRTAGDCLSDLGFKEAIPEMIETLKDPSKLVRWRAAMFLYEVGDETALPALKEAIEDPEFEVKMQIKMAIERIEGGEEGKGSVWHQMTQATKKKEG